nr:hypothetical protein [Kibdelosporangium sp. MJ126-NF4]
MGRLGVSRGKQDRHAAFGELGGDLVADLLGGSGDQLEIKLSICRACSAGLHKGLDEGRVTGGRPQAAMPSSAAASGPLTRTWETRNCA